MSSAIPCDLSFRYRGRDVRFRLFDHDLVCDHMRRDKFFFDGWRLMGMLRHIPPGASVVDVGAHIGNTAVWFACVCGARRVVAIEPDRRHFELLSDNVALNNVSGIVTPINAAVGSAVGKAGCVRRVANNSGATAYRLSESGDVGVVTLDSLVSCGVITSADVLKIDVEGYECSVIDGADMFFRMFSPVVIAEVWADRIPKGYEFSEAFDPAANRKRFFDKMASLGYRTVGVHGDDYVLVRDDSWHTSVLDRMSAVSTAESSKGAKMEADQRTSSMWDRFDAIAVLRTTDYTARQDGLLKELERVGLLGRVEWFWDFDNPFMVRLANNLRLSPDIKSMAGFRRTMNHYRAVKTLSELGHKHVLVLEDDVRFLRDTDALASAIEAMPADYDVAKLEWTGHLTRGASSIPDIRGPWHRLSGFDTYGVAAVAYSDRGMRWRAGLIEEVADYSKIFVELHMVDVYDNSPTMSRLNAYVASPLAAVQNFTGDGVHGQDRGTYKLYGGYLADGGVSAYAVD